MAFLGLLEVSKNKKIKTHKAQVTTNKKGNKKTEKKQNVHKKQEKKKFIDTLFVKRQKIRSNIPPLGTKNLKVVKKLKKETNTQNKTFKTVKTSKRGYIINIKKRDYTYGRKQGGGQGRAGE